MRHEVLDLIVCPDCEEYLRVVEECTGDGKIESGTLECSDGRRRLLIERFVARFDSSDGGHVAIVDMSGAIDAARGEDRPVA